MPYPTTSHLKIILLISKSIIFLTMTLKCHQKQLSCTSFFFNRVTMWWLVESDMWSYLTEKQSTPAHHCKPPANCCKLYRVKNYQFLYYHTTTRAERWQLQRYPLSGPGHNLQIRICFIIVNQYYALFVIFCNLHSPLHIAVISPNSSWSCHFHAFLLLFIYSY